ncbi:hypothetical protein H4K36_25115 [Streptomyces sp. DHE7-1]|uniref:hypothetical protein n=1 Tax=unclassified Streptomyces TaxID=2593676 RepID=UPI0018EEB9BD|nr:hypothetical protein [Streptomyces sp. DHE7-1]
MGSENSVCPVCGQPVETVVGRHKTLGAWVPKWGPGPCRNPDCASRAEHTEQAVPGAPETGTEPTRPGAAGGTRPS